MRGAPVWRRQTISMHASLIETCVASNGLTHEFPPQRQDKTRCLSSPGVYISQTSDQPIEEQKSFTCWWSCERLRRSSIVPVEGLHRTGPKPALVAPHPWLGLGVRGCSDVTLLTHVDGSLSSHARMSRPVKFFFFILTKGGHYFAFMMSTVCVCAHTKLKIDTHQQQLMFDLHAIINTAVTWTFEMRDKRESIFINTFN